MAGKKTGRWPGGVPLSLLVAGVHAVVDLATHASCPTCGGQVILYWCQGCKKVVWPNRGGGAGSLG